MKKNISENNKNGYSWFRMDNLAKIFPSNSSSRLTTLFRLTAILKVPVKITILQKAFNNMLIRCPYFKVQLKAGFFWYYFQTTPLEPRIMADFKYPCIKMHFKKEGVLLIRVMAFKNRISVEFSHMLTDGMGALTFLRSITAEYLRLSGVEISRWDNLLKHDDVPDNDEWEESFKKHYQKNIPSPVNVSRAYHVPFKFIKKGEYNIITGIMSVNEVLKKAKEKNAGLTEFFAALYFDVLQDIYFQYGKNKKNPIRISIPVNLRNIYKSKTMRNFFLTVSPEIDPRLGRFTFDEILQKVRYFIKVEINKKLINQQIKRNVSFEKHPFVRIVPLFIKNIALSFVYNYAGENQYSTNISNLGLADMPENLSEYIEGFDMCPPPNPIYKISCGMVSYKDRLSVTFGKLIKEKDVEKLFFTKLVKMGINVKIETN